MSSPPVMTSPLVVSLSNHVRRVIARLRGRASGRAVLEVEIDEDGAWTLPAELLLALADGSEVRLAVHAAGSTGTQRVRAGQTVRVVLDAAPPAGEILEWSVPGTSPRIVLDVRPA